MTAEVYHYYPNPIEDVFNAYARAIQDCFKVTGACYQYHTITFPLKFSFKYNMNGGNCTLNFIRHQDGTAVRVNYNIYQLIAALYDSHDRDMTLYVQRILGSFATPIFLSPMDFANPDNRVMSNGTTAAPNGAAYPPVSPNGAAYPPPMAPKEETATPGTPPPIRVAKGNYCIHCGSQQSSDTEFCQTCGKKRKN